LKYAATYVNPHIFFAIFGVDFPPTAFAPFSIFHSNLNNITMVYIRFATIKFYSGVPLVYY